MLVGSVMVSLSSVLTRLSLFGLVGLVARLGESSDVLPEILRPSEALSWCLGELDLLFFPVSHPVSNCSPSLESAAARIWITRRQSNSTFVDPPSTFGSLPPPCSTSTVVSGRQTPGLYLIPAAVLRVSGGWLWHVMTSAGITAWRCRSMTSFVGPATHTFRPLIFSSVGKLRSENHRRAGSHYLSIGRHGYVSLLRCGKGNRHHCPPTG